MISTRWLLPTNTGNLGAMIAQGLISDQQGFRKYYNDILSENTGYIPVICENEKQGMISDALEKAVSEDSGLTPCIIEINLKHIKNGNVHTENGDAVDISDISNWFSEKPFPNKLLIPAPLPLSCIAVVLFKTQDEKKEFIHDTKTIYRNVTLNSIKLGCLTKKDVRKFSSADRINQPNLLETNGGSLSPSASVVEMDEVEPHSVVTENSTKTSINYHKTYSFGGLLGALFYATKNGKLTTDAFNKACKSSKVDNIDIYDYPMIYNYFYPSDTPPGSISSINMLFHDILDIIVNSDKKDCKDSVIKLLYSDKFIVDEAFSDATIKLANYLVAFYRDTIEKNIFEIFSESKSKNKDRSNIKLLLLMLFHREDVESLADFHLDMLEEEDYILFAMLFGARDKFTGLPKFLREYDGLQIYVSNLMAQYAHHAAQTGIVFNNVKAPLTLVDILKSSKLEFILQTSKQLGIHDCFCSIMPNVSFINKKGISEYSGIILPKIRKDEKKYFAKMSSLKIDSKLYNKILEKYRKY